MKFRTVLKQKDVYLYYGEDAFPNATEKESTADAYVNSIIIYWGADVECREWGIKSIITQVYDFEFTVYSEDDDYDLDEKLTGTSHVWNSKDFTVVDEFIRTDDSYAITSMEINFKDKTIILNS